MKRYGIYEHGYPTVAIFTDIKTAKKFCEAVNTKIVRRKVKGKVVVKRIDMDRFYVKEIECQCSSKNI